MAVSHVATCTTECNIKIIDFISSSLDSGNYKEAISALTDDKYKECFSDYCWELVAKSVDKIEDDTIIIKPSLYGACEKIISHVVGKCTTEDALLEFIERLEFSRNDAQFGIILPVLQQLLQKLPANKKRSLEWCFYAITNYTDKIKLTEHNLEGDERKLIDSDPEVRRVTKLYTMIVQFYQPFIDEVLAADGSVISTKQIITDFLICLLGKPMIYIDIDPNANEKSEARQACATIIQDFCRLQKNLLKFLIHFEKKERQQIRLTNNANDSQSQLETDERTSMTDYAGLFYVAYSGHFEIPDLAIPQVYSNEYIIHNLMIAVIDLLNYTEYGPLSKALALYQALNNRMAQHTSHELLSSIVHYDLCKRLVNVTIFCNYQSLRKSALNSIGAHINKFDYKGRYALIKYLIDTTNHSGMIGYALSLYKQSLNESFKDEVLNECFTKYKLSAILRKACFLPYAAETDLMEHADQIISTLNFLRFLVLKDKKNATSIKSIIPVVEKSFLNILVTALKMSKAHYELKLKNLNDGTDMPDIPLSVGGTILESIPADRKKVIVESALNGFHLMEALLARLNECIKPLFNSDQESQSSYRQQGSE